MGSAGSKEQKEREEAAAKEEAAKKDSFGSTMSAKLLDCIAKGSESMATVFIKGGADVSAIVTNDAHKTPILSVAVAAGMTALASLLIDRGANVKAADAHSETVLMAAVRAAAAGKIESSVPLRIIGLGANVEAVCNSPGGVASPAPVTALSLCNEKTADIAEALRTKGATS